MSKITVTTIAGQTSGGDANTVKIESGDDFIVDTNVLKVDASNNRVGMGVASPSRQVEISRSIADGSGELAIVSSDSSTSGAFGSIHFGNNTDTSLASIRAIADGATDSGKLTFNTEKTGAAIEVAMSIDSNGRVTKPLQPAFMAYGTQSSPSSGSVLVFGTEKYDIGGNYNTSNGRFTAPVAGLYMLITTQIGSNRNTVFRFKTRLNGTNYPQTDAQMRLNPGAAIHDYGTSVILMQMAANDYADIYFTSDDGGVGHGNSGSAHEIFSGYLVG